MRLENENLLANLKESSEELTKLNAENQSLMEERAMGEVVRERTEIENNKLQGVVRELTTEINARNSQMEEMSKKVEAGKIIDKSRFCVGWNLLTLLRYDIKHFRPLR